MVLLSRFPGLDVPQVDFYRYNADKIKQYGDKVAVIHASSNRQLTFRQIHDGSIKLASAFTKFGLKKQEVVAICAANCVEYSLIVLGASACNAISTTCNPRHTKMEIQRQLENCRPKIVVTDSERVDKVLEIAKSVHSIQKVISVDPSSKCLSLWSIIEQDDGKDFPFHTTFNVHDDVLFLLYSSGTTGLPKGVMLTHHNSVSILSILMAYDAGNPFKLNYSAIPMFHVYGMNSIFNNLSGSTFVVDKRFQVESLFKAVEKYKITGVNGVPAVLMELVKSPLAKNYDLSSLKAIGSGAAPLAPKVVIETMKKMKAFVGGGWGLTESGGLCTIGMFNEKILGSVGLLVPMYSLKVVDPDSRKELGVNEDGELLIKGPGVMKGYYKNPKANATVFEEGWLCTGDVGHYDEHGYVYIVDRIKELIKYKGFQVAPAELESLLLTHPKVLDVGVTGIPDPDAGEIPRAFVVKKDPSVTEQELHSFVKENLSKYKYLRGGIYFLDHIPRSDTGKILRRQLAKKPVASKSKL